MKLAITVFCFVFPSLCIRATTPTLRVHEWGTFTVVVGSDGSSVPWWTPTLEGPASLPEFVARHALLQKAAAPCLIRMETPVLYFYPSGPMTASVSVRYPAGQITEVFPTAPGFMRAPPLPSPLLHSLVSIETPNSLLDATPPTVWNITLRDPKEAVSLAKVPVVGDHGAHYRHAREVPDAWLVESDSQFEHFIFYRGTGNHYLPVNVVNTRDDIWEMGHTVVDTSHLRAFQVHVKGAQLRWAETPPIPRFGSAVAETSSSSDPAKFDSSQSNLVKSLTTALTEEGLTPAEAAAMVHTWEDAWMKEDGTRLLVLLPQESIDAVLPLSITPQPAETRRVFVARLELLNTTTESHIGRLLDAWPNLSDEDKTFAKSLGRIKSAAFGRAVQIQHNKLLQRSGEVQAALEQ